MSLYLPICSDVSISFCSDAVVFHGRTLQCSKNYLTGSHDSEATRDYFDIILRRLEKFKVEEL